MSNDDPNVRYDYGGWISGPMLNLEPTLDDVKRAFPDWTVYRGTDQLWHARRTDASPPVNIVTGEDLLDLVDQIRREMSRQRHAGYERFVSDPRTLPPVRGSHHV